MGIFDEASPDWWRKPCWERLLIGAVTVLGAVVLACVVLPAGFVGGVVLLWLIVLRKAIRLLLRGLGWLFGPLLRLMDRLEAEGIW